MLQYLRMQHFRFNRFLFIGSVLRKVNKKTETSSQVVRLV
jgi:hypothetical protein